MNSIKKDKPAKEDGKLIIVTAPSGAGKTTIVRHLLKTIPGLAFSVSACTRPKRKNEIDGKDYYFITKKEFIQRIERGEFLEWEEVYDGNYYGTLKSEVDGLLGKGLHVLLDIDIKGAQNIKSQYGKRALTVFIKPPNIKVLEQRLQKRQTEDSQSYEKRIAKAMYEMTFESHFDKVVINDAIDVAFTEAEKIVVGFLNK